MSDETWDEMRARCQERDGHVYRLFGMVRGLVFADATPEWAWSLVKERMVEIAPEFDRLSGPPGWDSK